nr:DUF5131 family protein [Seonamhaeicola sp. ML3]
MSNYSKTKINWTDFSWNPWTGCTKVSAGCKFCYIDSIEINLGRNPKRVKRTSNTTWNKPLNISKGSIIFTCSMSDFFHPDADEWRNEAWNIIKNTSHHTYLILTKRPERIKDALPKDWCQQKYSHVWLGTSIENNDPKVLDRIRILKEIKCQIRFISFEPLLEDLKLSPKDLKGIHWAIIGGESGRYKSGRIPQFREANPEWFRHLRDTCKSAGVLVWFKQAGTYIAHKYKMTGKGEVLSQIPPDLQIRERPDLNQVL